MMNIECSQGRHAEGGKFCTRCGQRLDNRDARNKIIWGIGIVVVAGGITLVTYIAAAPGGTYWLAWGPTIWGGYMVFRGLARASNLWRALGLVTVAVVATGNILVFQDSRDEADYFNSTEIGDCLDQNGFPTGCAEPDAREVRFIKRYPDDMVFPGSERFYADSEACPAPAGYYYAPTQETWDQGDRLLLCVVS